MAHQHDIRPDMQVLGSDGGVIGSVDGVEGDQIKLKRGSGTEHHFVPQSWVTRVDDHVHLNRSAALARDTWTAGPVGAAAAAGTRDGGAHPRQSEGKGKIPWIIGAVLLLLILFLLVRGLQYGGQADGTLDQPAPITEGSGGADATANGS